MRRSQSSFVINGCLLNIGLGLACYFLYLEFLAFVLASWKTVLQSNVKDPSRMGSRFCCFKVRSLGSLAGDNIGSCRGWLWQDLGRERRRGRWQVGINRVRSRVAVAGAEAGAGAGAGSVAGGNI